MKNLINNINNVENDNSVLKICRGVVISILVTLVLLFFLSIILTYSNISENIIPISIVITSGVSILIGSVFTTKKMKRKGIVYGGIIGFIYILLIYLISSITNKSFSINIYSIMMIIFSLLSGMLGGILGVNTNNI